MKLSIIKFIAISTLFVIPEIAHAEKPNLMALIGVSGAADDAAARDNSGEDFFGNASTYGLSSSDHNSFVVDYGASGILKGYGRCSTREGNEYDAWGDYWDRYELLPENVVENLTDETGQTGAKYCYCGLYSYTPAGDSAQSLSGPWLFRQEYYDGENCEYYCAGNCAVYLQDGSSSSLSFRAAVFGAYPVWEPGDPGIITTQTYVDNKLATKQAKITTTGTNKLMTYGSSAGATPGSRDIVSTLGTSTTVTTVPEVGPIVTGLNGKQNTVNGTANYVMTGTGTAGTLGEKPVYSATTNYTNALVTAQTINTAAANAANSELSCVDNDCLLWQINTSGPTGISTTIIYIGNPAIAGTGECCRGFGGQSFNDKSGCTGTANSYMGSVGNKSGRWGVTFPYGDVMGISVCSTDYYNPYTRGYVADNAKGEALNLDYERQKGSSTNVGGTCWCKMQAPAVSSWVIAMMYGSSNNGPSNCRGACASACASTITNNYSNVRTIMYNTLQ